MQGKQAKKGTMIYNGLAFVNVRFNVNLSIFHYVSKKFTIKILKSRPNLRQKIEKNLPLVKSSLIIFFEIKTRFGRACINKFPYIFIVLAFIRKMQAFKYGVKPYRLSMNEDQSCSYLLHLRKTIASRANCSSLCPPADSLWIVIASNQLNNDIF